MKTTLIALALLASGAALPAAAKQAQHHMHKAMNAQAQIAAPRPVAGTAVPAAARIGSDGRLHDPDMEWEIRNEEMHGMW
jgi:hypothetical protein